MSEQNPVAPIWEKLQAEFRKALGVPEWGDMVHDLVPGALKEAYDMGRADASSDVAAEKLVVDLVREAYFGDENAVKELLDKGVDVNGLDRSVNNYYGATPLIAASRNGHIKIARLLIENGADLNAVDVRGHTPLMAASKHVRKDIVKLLVKSGADVNAIDCDGRTALMYAALKPLQKDSLRQLVDNGADVNAVDKHGFTALIIAAMHNQFKYAQLLIESGADVNAKTNDGIAAIAVTYSEDCKTSQLLLQHGANINDRRMALVTDLRFYEHAF